MKDTWEDITSIPVPVGWLGEDTTLMNGTKGG